MPGCRNRKTLFENDVHYHNSKDQVNPNCLKNKLYTRSVCCVD